MQIKVLGCSGGVGGNMRTTSLLVDGDVLIDAGTGVGDLSLEALLKIDHIFVTHAHLDHIAFIPLLVDTAMGLRAQPVTLHATQAVIDVLKQHIFNWHIWPDFNQIPNRHKPFLVYQALSVGDTITINDKTITALPANHVVPAVGYQINSGAQSLVFTGDTAGGSNFWQAVNSINNLSYLIIETAFSNAEAVLALRSKHLCPNTLADELLQLNTIPKNINPEEFNPKEFNPKELNLGQSRPEVFITHLKPGEVVTIMREIAANSATQHCKALQNQQVFVL